jgi:Rrf2 family protein
VVFELAMHHGDGPIAVQVLARRQGISEPYLEQLMPALKRAGLVESVRGPQGGYVLTNPPDSVTVGDVVRALEGPIEVATCTTEEPHDCPELDRCIGPDVWSRVQQVLVEVMDGMTFQELVEQQRQAVRARVNAAPLTPLARRETTA